MFVADMVAPVLKVAKESDKYYVWDASNGFRLPSARRADGSAANQVEMTLSENAYSAEEFALKVKITDRQKNNADSVLRLKQSKTGFLKDLIQLEREKRVATLLTTQGNYATGHYDTLSGANRWNDPSFSGSIEETIDTGKEAVRQRLEWSQTRLSFLPPLQR
jgi:hypothetical protein